MNREQARTDFAAADAAWSAELKATFGKRAGDARYTAEGKGHPGSKLRTLHDAFTAARIAWQRSVGIAS